MKFCSSNYEDLKKYFQGSYMKFPLIGDEVVYVQKVTPDAMSGTQLDNSETNGWTFTFGDDRQFFEVEFLLPHKSYFEFNGEPHLLTRIPNKQYKRGICNDNTNIYRLGAGGFDNVGTSLESVNAYTHKPEFKGFTNDTSSGYVVAPRIAVAQGGEVLIDKKVVAQIYYDDNVLLVQHELFLPELERAFETRRTRSMQLVSRKTYKGVK